MTEFIFTWLEKFGYTHPVHVPLTHLPMGLVMGAAFFTLIAVFFKKPVLLPTVKHCFILTLVTIPPTAFAGYMDWQHAFRGVWSPYIALKIAMATLLFVMSIVNIRKLGKESPKPGPLLATVGISLLAALLLGFAGGELQYGK